MFRYKALLIIIFSLIIAACNNIEGDSSELPTGKILTEWTETDVRKVLHIFAYGGQATDEQISTWASMDPRVAITEILSFEEVNNKLSPTVDNTAANGGKLKDLMDFWSSTLPTTDAINPYPDSNRLTERYGTFITYPDNHSTFPGQTFMSNSGLQLTWMAAVNKYGLNPFRQKFGLFLTNYNMSVNLTKVRPTLIRDLYDSSMDLLKNKRPYYEVLANGAYSAAVAMQYGHRTNRYLNGSGVFLGNDDFAREFHQLFFRILGEDEDPNYHENISIEHTAWILTGMDIDMDPTVYDWKSKRRADFWVAPINFTDHTDNAYKENRTTVMSPEGTTQYVYTVGTHEPRNILNRTRHYSGSLDVLHNTISGGNAKSKLNALAKIAANTEESLNNLPVYIINHFADDNLDDQKRAHIRELWRAAPGQDVLTFLQQYAISDTFLRRNSYKYRNAFDRNLTIYNLNTVDNEEAYNNEMPISFFHVMKGQGAHVFYPAHDVFGGQTSLAAANNSDVFRLAYNESVGHWRIVVYRQSKRDENNVPITVTDANGKVSDVIVWEKDWSRLVPTTNVGGNDVYLVNDVGEWLWNRFIADGLKNYTELERAYVNSLLATGKNFAEIAAVKLNRPLLLEDLASTDILATSKVHANAELLLTVNTNDRVVANRNVGLAINFIVATPFMFAIGG